MTKRYTGGVVSSSLPTVNAAGASGVFLLSQQSDYQSRNSWPPYKVEKSLRIRSSATAYLNRTPSSAGNSRIFTMSCWVKIGSPSYGSEAQITFLNAGDGTQTNGTNDEIQLRSDGTAYQVGVLGKGGTGGTYAQFTPYLRDPSAWYHVVIAIDTTQATQANRCRAYVNGVEQTAYITNGFTLNYSFTYLNSTSAHLIGRNNEGSGPRHTDAYFAEYNFIDGQALTPSSFGATDKDGNWSPIAYTGTYGTNGFYLNFKDVTSAATTGYDYSGNGNNWTLSGFNVSTANTTYDIMIDVPEDQSDGTANNRGSYCTFNPLDKDSDITTSNGNLAASTSTVAHNLIRSTIAIPSSGKFYAEMSFNQTMSGNPAAAFALIAPTSSLTDHIVSAGNYSVYGSASTTLNSGATSGASVTGMTSGQTWQIAVDADNNQAWVGLNNAWFNVYTSGATTGNPSTNTNPTFTGTMAGLFFGADFVNSSGSINFGQRPFTYAPPSGFKTLNTFNLPEPTIKQPNKYFDATLYAGNNGTQSVINAGNFQPDLVWLKNRTNAYTHLLYDAIRGVGTLKAMSSSETSAEGGLSDNSTFGYLSALNSNGFTVVSGSTAGSYTNSSSNNYVGWQWNAGGANTTNTNGSVTSIVRNNPTAGFSIVTYNTGSAGTQTVGHGLGVTPAMIIIKSRINTGAHWDVWHKSFANPAQGYMYLNLTNALANDARNYSNTAPTSSLFTYESGYEFTANQNYVAYFWAEIEGYSKFGSYIGNGSTDGPFVYTGFRPRIIIAKVSSTAGYNWVLFDSARSPTNVASAELYPNLANAEGTDSSFDLLSNGFKLRVTSGNKNLSGQTYIYAAFAEAPFKYSRSR